MRPYIEEDMFAPLLSASQPPVASQADDPLDDVFGLESDAPPDDGGPSASEPSDVARLRREHVTAGYRDGLIEAKSKSIQAGFDEGFSLGATIGMRAGELVGLLEGIARAISTTGGSSTMPSPSDAEQRLAEATRELSTRSVFAAEYWAPDGTWIYELQPATGDEDAVFSDVAGSHPLIRKWTDIVEAELRRYGLDRSVLSSDAEPHEPGPEQTSTVDDSRPSLLVLEW